MSANLGQSLPQDQGKPGFYIRSDLAHFVHVLEMHLILQTEARELHADQVSKRYQS